MIPTIYRGSVKDVLGPVSIYVAGAQKAPQGVIFRYTDSYSVFDWGKMPDPLAHKGEALAILAAEWFEQLERAETWREFSKTSEALGLRKASRYGAEFIECGERLKQEGLRTHYLGVLPEESLPRSGSTGILPKRLEKVSKPFRQMMVCQVSVVRPIEGSVLGRSVPDYYSTRTAIPPRLIPLEVVFRFSCPPGSSLFNRLESEPDYLSVRGFGEVTLERLKKPGFKLDFPALELFTKLETSDRPLTLGEAVAISGIGAATLQDLLFKTAWVAGFLKAACARCGLELADGKLEWGLSENGDCFLVDAVGPDELRILKDGLQLSKEFLRTYYRSTPWYHAIENAKKQAGTQGTAEWKRLVAAQPPALPQKYREVANHLYPALTNRLTGKPWFTDSWDMDRVLQALGDLKP